MLLNGFDVDTASGTRQVELRVGDLPGLDLDVALLVVSAFEGDDAPVAGTLLGRLQQAYGIRLDRLACALDLRQSPLKCWVSEAIDWAELQTQKPGDPPTDPPKTRFQRIAVVEGTVLDWQPDDLLPWPPFNRLFSLLALLPMRQIQAASVASPLLGSGDQGIDPLLHFPDLLEGYRAAFRHVPELQQLILFDRTDLSLKVLGEAIDAALVRPTPASARLPLPEGLAGLGQLPQLLRQSQADLQDKRVSLFVGINLLPQRGVDPWLISCLHQIRCFGNWMVHPQGPGQRRKVEVADVLAVLASLQRVLAEVPWEREKR